MTTIAYILLFLSLGLLVYHYLIFPLLLKLLAKNKADYTEKFTLDELPKISILLAVYNEEKVLKEKIESTFNTAYPLEKIEFWIGSDASSDTTDSIISEYQKTFSQIKFHRFGGRTGKPEIINQLEKKASGEFLVLTDANVFFDTNTLFELVSYFKREDIGLVGGNILNQETKKDGISNQEKAYLSGENKTKYYEGILWGTMMGAFGGLYAIRKKHYIEVPKGYIVDDFFISLKVMEQDFKSINALNAFAYEDVSNIPQEEFRRKVRIGIGNFQNLFHFKHLIFGRLSLSFTFISHKILRWKGPFFLIFAYLSSAYLSFSNSYILFLFLGLNLLFLSPLLDVMLKKLKIHLKLLRFASHFILMNLALLLGFIKFMSGNYSSTWTPTQRNQ